MASDHEASQVTRFPLVAPGDSETSALVTIVRRLTTARSLGEIMDIVTHAARVLVGADGITFVLRDGDQCFYAEEDAISPLWKGRRFPMSACISGWCMIERRPAAIGDITQDDRIPQDAYRPTFVRSLAMVPVQQDDPVAALGAYWARVRTIQPQEIELLQTVANASALATAYVRATYGERQDTLISDERNHRLRNVLAVVQAVVNRSLRDDPDRAATINKRVKALLANDEILGDGGQFAAPMRDILHAELNPYGRGRIALTGQELELPPSRKRAVAAIVHEWSTNAAKYGAFSVPNGRVSVSWLRAGDEVCMIWQELGGPELVDSGKHGFGTYFVERMAAGIEGSVETEMHPSGIVHVLRFRLA